MVFSVSEITSKIKEVLETAIGNITVEGEISNCRPSSTGHLYFTLKEKSDNSEFALSAVMFKWQLSKLTFKAEDGMKVQATGNISVYEARGTYQIIVTSMAIAGEGEILRILEERKKKLAEEGLFSRKKKPIPSFVTRLAVITSPTGAAVRDIIKVAKKRNPNININILPAVVQGEQAASSLIEQLKIANKYTLGQVIIIGRGGGSLEDLLAFSDEQLAREIAASEIPVISAVGHEIDTSISDYVADLRAATPSEASEIAVTSLSDIILDISSYKTEIIDSMNLKIERIKLMTQALSKDRLDLQFKSIAQPFLMRLDDSKASMVASVENLLRSKKHRLEYARQALLLSNPQAILDRGFSIVKNLGGTIIRNSANLAENEELNITLAKGSFSAITNTINK